MNESSASSRVPRRHRRRTPIPTQIVSNGEYLPPSQSATQNKVEARINELADLNGKHVGLNRRQFLHTSCGMAGAFLAMNDIYGNVFQVAPAEAREPDDQARAEYGRKRAKQRAKALRYCLGKKRPIVFHGVQNGHRNWNEEKLRFIYDDQILE